MFEWDEQKRLINIGKHDLDFRDATFLFDGRPIFTGLSDYSEEVRFVSVGQIDNKFFTVVWTWRNDTRRIISYRRARDVEKRKYRQIYS
jgi:uncharacterized protein